MVLAPKAGKPGAGVPVARKEALSRDREEPDVGSEAPENFRRLKGYGSVASGTGAGCFIASASAPYRFAASPRPAALASP